MYLLQNLLVLYCLIVYRQEVAITFPCVIFRPGLNGLGIFLKKLFVFRPNPWYHSCWWRTRRPAWPRSLRCSTPGSTLTGSMSRSCLSWRQRGCASVLPEEGKRWNWGYYFKAYLGKSFESWTILDILFLNQYIFPFVLIFPYLYAPVFCSCFK